MPTLDWIGKQAVVNHHKTIPFHLLKVNPELSVGDPNSGNLIVLGDNLRSITPASGRFEWNRLGNRGLSLKR